MFFDDVNHLRVFRVMNHLDMSILESLAFLSSRSISTSKECLKVRFRGENREKSLLEY